MAARCARPPISPGFAPPALLEVRYPKSCLVLGAGLGMRWLRNESQLGSCEKSMVFRLDLLAGVAEIKNRRATAGKIRRFMILLPSERHAEACLTKIPLGWRWVDARCRIRGRFRRRCAGRSRRSGKGRGVGGGRG